MSVEQIQDAMDEILHRLEGWERAYPLDIFSEPTEAEREWLHENKRGLMDRIAASMGRHMAGCIREDLAKLREAARALEAAPKVGEGFVVVPVDSLECAMQLLYLASNGRENIFANTAHEFRDLLAAAPTTPTDQQEKA